MKSSKAGKPLKIKTAPGSTSRRRAGGKRSTTGGKRRKAGKSTGAQTQSALESTLQSRIVESFFSHTLSMVAILDRDFNFIRVNEAYAKADGRQVSEFPGRNHFEFYPSEAKAIFEQVVREKKPCQIFARPFVYAGHPERGTTYWDWALVPVLDKSGDVEMLIFVLHDVTERVRAQEALRDSEEKFKYVFDHSPIGKSLTLPDGRINVNRAFCAMLGYSAEELKTRRWQEITHPDDLEMTNKEVEQLLSGGKHSARFVKRYIHKNGSVVWADVSTFLRQDQDGKPLYFITSVNNITERKQAEDKIQRLNEELEQRVVDRTAQYEQANEALNEEIAERKRAQGALQASNQRVIDVLESIQDGFFTVDRDWRFTYINQRAAENVGYRPKELIGQNLWETFPQILDTAHETHYRQAMERGTPLNFEVSGALTPGTYDVRVYPTPEGISVYWIDITRRKCAEEEVRRLNEDLQSRARDLEAANKELEAFAYSVSHDLRAPLRHINGYVELLLKNAPALDEKNRRYLDVISDSARRMGTLIDDLLNFSRMGRAEIRKTRVNMEELAQEAIHDLSVDLAGRDVLLRVDPLPPAFGDRAMLKLVFTNLIGNALKFTRTREKARIEIGQLKIGDSTTARFGISNLQSPIYYVRDNGVGFDMQYAAKLFGLFQRLHSAAEFEGTGVGLANVHRIIHRHGGRTWAEGRVDEGAAFYFTLPGDLSGFKKPDRSANGGES